MPQNQSQVSSQSQEISSQKSNDIYERHLTLKERGFPLWVPDPNQVLHLNYRRTGVRIGDVGIITDSGAFSFLFNICLPHNDPVNPRKLPDHFSPISPPIEDTDINKFGVFKNELSRQCFSEKITNRRCHFVRPNTHPYICELRTLSSCCDIVFVSSASEGAILIMPRGARSEDLRNLALFREYVAANVASWYRYVNGPRGREAKNGDVRLVVGFHKTTSWGIATFANQTQQSSCRLRFGPSEGNSASSYTWFYSGSSDVKAGPDSDEIDELEIDSDPPDVRFENQCLFVRTLNATLSEDAWADIHSSSSSGSISIDPRNSQYPRVKNYSNSNRPHSNNPDNGSNFSSSQGAQSGTQRGLQGVDITSSENLPIFVSGPVEVLPVLVWSLTDVVHYLWLLSLIDSPSIQSSQWCLASQSMFTLDWWQYINHFQIPTAKMVITHDGDWSSVTQASRTIVFSFSTSWCSTFQYDTLWDPHELVANILASRDICEENGKIV